MTKREAMTYLGRSVGVWLVLSATLAAWVFLDPKEPVPMGWWGTFFVFEFLGTVAYYMAVGLGLLAWGATSFRKPTPVGRCSSCRYDLTGNVSGVCPECGTRVG